MLDIGEAIGAGFRVLRERPVAGLIWAAVYFVATAIIGAISLPLIRQQMLAAQSGDFSGAAPFMVEVQALNILMVLVMLVLWSASYRAVLRPEDDRFGYLRLGGDELRLFLLSLIFLIVAVAVLFAVSLLFGVLGAGAMLAMGGGRGGGASAGGILIAVVLSIALLAAMVFLSVRFALAFPLTFQRRKIVIGAAWRLSRGSFWAMLVAFLVVAVIYMILATLVTLITGAGYLSMMASSFSDPAHMGEAARQMIDSRLGGLTAMRVLSWVLSTVAGTVWIAMSGCGLADAARQLTPDSAEEIAAIWE
ncbi:hypothetical protein [Stakelama marina]|uniref:Glycerophosphoryl diester phosphodiesterase membrane domain-containing protein n=1 Tax=Stakelama marina TaxID=2826939 RepID=A0A8T4IGZ8_9SPHN|nr:hypothetical protein [Stakelama marina]MBR0553867.1 hypothetical protein [Stakelama marina]